MKKLNKENNELVVKPTNFLEEEFAFDALLQNELTGVVAGTNQGTIQCGYYVSCTFYGICFNCSILYVTVPILLEAEVKK